MSPKQQADPKRYGSAWSAIIQLVRDGHSWSGHERNRLLLNRGGAEFADVSSISGLDHGGDGRAMAMVDWDQDGDLDVWYRDRTAPRLRLMLNQHAPGEGSRDFVALRLEGTTSNRDAIGAVVEVVVDDASKRLVKSVRAGDLFLSQSSRRLHFGLGDAGKIQEIKVVWPGGKVEKYSGAEVGGTYLLKEGTGAVVEVTRTPHMVRLTDPPSKAYQSKNARIILPAKIPLPPIGYRNALGKPQLIVGKGSPRLVMLWSASCEHCARDLEMLAKSADQLRAAGIDVVGLSVDGGDGISEAYNLVDSTKWPFEWGMIEPDAVDRIDEFQRALFDLTVPMAIPLTLLCDREGNVSVLYRGSLRVEEVLSDLKATEGANEDQLHALAPPFAGRWFTKPIDPAIALELMARQFEVRLEEDSLFYLEAAMWKSTGGPKGVLGEELVQKHYAFARRYKAEVKPERAAAHFERALAIAPSARIYHDYGTMLASHGELIQAKALLKKALILEPNLKPTLGALALVNKLIAEGK